MPDLTTTVEVIEELECLDATTDESLPLLDVAKAAGTPARMIDSYGVETVKQALTELLDQTARTPAIR